MYIRIKKNVSGSSTVMLLKSERRPGKPNAYSTLIKNFGTSNDPKVIAQYQQQAQAYKKLMGEENKTTKLLKVASSKDIAACGYVNLGFHSIYGKIFDRCLSCIDSLTPRNKDLLKSLCVLRTADPCSKHRSAQISREYGYDFKVDSAYKLMDKIDQGVIESIKQSITQYSHRKLKAAQSKIEVVFYDLTTLYFEANEPDELRQFGFSKDGKSQHVQITLALLVTTEGLPLGYELFPGNMYEGKTLELILDKLSSTYQIHQAVIVADSGLLNKHNIALLTLKGYRYIIAARVKSMKKAHSEVLCDASGYQRISEDIQAKVVKYDDDNALVCCYSDKKARKDQYERAERLAKLLKKEGQSIKSLLPSKHNTPYVKVTHDARVKIDHDVVDSTAKYDGYYALITNIGPIEDIDPMAILSQYKGLWQIERSFRIMKTELSIRPVYHWSVPRMKAHFAICYISFAMVRYLQWTLKQKGHPMSPREIQDTLRSVRTTHVRDKNGDMFHLLHELSQEAKTIYKAVHVALPRGFTAQ